MHRSAAKSGHPCISCRSARGLEVEKFGPNTALIANALVEIARLYVKGTEQSGAFAIFTKAPDQAVPLGLPDTRLRGLSLSASQILAFEGCPSRPLAAPLSAPKFLWDGRLLNEGYRKSLGANSLNARRQVSHSCAVPGDSK